MLNKVTIPNTFSIKISDSFFVIRQLLKFNHIVFFQLQIRFFLHIHQEFFGSEKSTISS